MVLASCSRDSTRKLADTDEDGEIAKPDDDEAVYETSRSSTRVIC